MYFSTLNQAAQWANKHGDDFTDGLFVVLDEDNRYRVCTLFALDTFYATFTPLYCSLDQ